MSEWERELTTSYTTLKMRRTFSRVTGLGLEYKLSMHCSSTEDWRLSILCVQTSAVTLVKQDLAALSHIACYFSHFCNKSNLRKEGSILTQLEGREVMMGRM